MFPGSYPHSLCPDPLAEQLNHYRHPVFIGEAADKSKPKDAVLKVKGVKADDGDEDDGEDVEDDR